MKTSGSGGQGGRKVTRRCDASGKWVGPQPICEAIQCPPLTSPPHTTITQFSHTCGTKVRFSCDRGYELAGHEELECLETGQWSRELPSCASVTCRAPHINDSSFSNVNRSYAFGSVIEIKCNWCRQLVDGSGFLTCTANGEWDKPPPSCEWVSCPLPRFLDHGNITPLGQLYYCGTEVKFSCDDGYILKGSQSSQCMGNSTWSQNFPHCKEVKCPKLSVDNGEVLHNGTKLGGVATVSCDPCYQLMGSQSLQCQENSEWDTALPTCDLITCPSLTSFEHGQIHPYPEANSCLTNVSFQCEMGYEISGPDMITCTVGGQWSSEPPTCEVVQCPPIPSPTPNSRLCSGNHEATPTYSTILQYCCDEGYEMEAGHEGVISCTERGEWNGTLPTCSIVSCKVPKVPEYGFIHNVTAMDTDADIPSGYLPYASRLTYGCNEGYSLVGDGSITCGYGGQWSHPAPICDITECISACQYPVAPSNGRVVNVLQHGFRASRGMVQLGATAVFMCNYGYYLHGSGSRKCMADNVWSGPKPLCLPFDQPRSRFISRDPNDLTKWLTADTIHVTSMEPLYMACQTHMEDTGLALPIAKITGPPLDMDNIIVRQYGNPQRSQQLVLQPRTAEGGMTMEGTYRCQVQAKDNDTIVLDRMITVHIHAALCSPPLSVLHGTLKTSGTAPGSCLRYHCDPGHTLLGQNDRICLANGTWSSSESHCVSTVDDHCDPPNAGSHASIHPPPSSSNPDLSPSYSTGDVVTYSCAPTHTLVGSPTRTCLGANVWSGSRPVCAAMETPQG